MFKNYFLFIALCFSIIVISQDLDELFEISHSISVIFNGSLVTEILPDLTN